MPGGWRAPRVGEGGVLGMGQGRRWGPRAPAESWKLVPGPPGALQCILGLRGGRRGSRPLGWRQSWLLGNSPPFKSGA